MKIVDGVPKLNNPKILFTETTGHEDMIAFMSSYQCQDEKKVHYYPKGFLCWYGCNQYGEMNGFIQPIKRVPEYVWYLDNSNRGWKKMKSIQEKKMKLNEVIAKEPRGSPNDRSNIKPKLTQETKTAAKRRRKNEVKKRDG